MVPYKLRNQAPGMFVMVKFIIYFSMICSGVFQCSGSFSNERIKNDAPQPFVTINPKKIFMVNKKLVHIHQGPGLEYPAVGQLPGGALLSGGFHGNKSEIIDGKLGYWTYYFNGYIFSGYLLDVSQRFSLFASHETPYTCCRLTKNRLWLNCKNVQGSPIKVNTKHYLGTVNLFILRVSTCDDSVGKIIIIKNIKSLPPPSCGLSPDAHEIFVDTRTNKPVQIIRTTEPWECI